MKWISTTIKRKWLDKILSGEKTTERKVAKPYWKTRLDPLMGKEDVGINFLCGNPNHPTKPGLCVKYKVDMISLNELSDHQGPTDIDGVITKQWYEIHLGERIE